jgi:serine/threonine protein kinase
MERSKQYSCEVNNMENVDNNIGKQIGNYLLIQKLGAGTFGSVYLAQHRHLNRSLIAIKILKSAQFNTKEEQETFFNEAKFLEILKHRHILPILDVGIQEDLTYMMIEYAPNGSLRERILNQRPARLLMRDALLILSQVGQALQYAHRHNVVHRDLKPANILFNDKGEALLADFGIALQLKKGTEYADAIGTPPYMAPEQFDKKASMKSDQYALGCIAYELFTGRTPIVAPPNASPLVWMHRVQKEEPPPPRQYNPDLSVNIEEAVLKALSKNRNNRYADVATFITSMTSQTPLLEISDLPTTLIDLVAPNKTIEQWLAEGDSSRKNNQQEEALVAYEQAIQLGHNDPIAYYYMGHILNDLKKFEEALVAYEKAIQLDPDRGIFHGGKGNVHRELKHYADALKAYDEAIRLSPNTPIFYIKKGDVLLDLRDYEKSVEAYNQAIRVSSNNVINARAHVGKGNALLRLRHNKEAIEAYEKAIQLDPNIASASLYLAKGDAFWRGGQNEEALKAYERGIELDTENEILQQKRTAMLHILKSRKNARR